MKIEVKELLDEVHAKINDIKNIDKLEKLMERYRELLDWYNLIENTEILKKYDLGVDS